MGELKNRGREGINENQDNFREIQENAEQSLEEKLRNQSIMNSLEGVDDDDKASIEDSRNKGQEIADQIAESRMEKPKSEVNSKMERTINEMKDLEGRERDDSSKAGAMDGNYGGIGGSLENIFEKSANEFNEIASSGEEIKEHSNSQIDNFIQKMKEDW